MSEPGIANWLFATPLERVSNEENERLVMLVTDNEVWLALKLIGSFKAPAQTDFKQECVRNFGA